PLRSMVTPDEATTIPDPAQARSWVRTAFVVTACPQDVIFVHPALTFSGAAAGQSEAGWQPVSSSLPRATFVPVGAVVKWKRRIPRPRSSAAPPGKPFPSARLPVSLAASPITRIPSLALPAAVVVLTDAELPATPRPIESLPDTVVLTTEDAFPSSR